LTDALNKIAGQRAQFQPNELGSGLNAVISVWLPDPHYGGPAKEELITPEVESIVRDLTCNRVERWNADSPGEVERVIDFLDGQRVRPE
jgi:DNA gyrase/topoisomerase IV subunit B